METIGYPDGLGGRADFKSKLSPGYSLGSAGVNFRYKGNWSSNLVPPSESNGDTYSLTVNVSGIPGNPGPGDYIVFQNGNWNRVIDSNEMSVSADGKIYFSSYLAYLFLSEI